VPSLSSLAYRLAMRRLVAFSTAVVIAAVTLVVGVPTQARPTASQLRLDGIPFRPELALTAHARARGLMHRRQAPKDGMLFVFPSATSGGFWMKNTLVPLRITFYDTRGKRVRQLLMTPCRRDPCRSYSAGQDYRFALELPARDPRPARRLGPFTELRRLTRLAR
jgi:uncharacterized membrane protein (UPF0127 family)